MYALVQAVSLRVLHFAKSYARMELLYLHKYNSCRVESEDKERDPGSLSVRGQKNT